MEYKLDMTLLSEDIKNNLGLEEKAYGITTKYSLYNVLTYDNSKSIKGKSFINDINSGFCSPGYVFGKGKSILFLENFRAISTRNSGGYTSDLDFNLSISCLVEGGIIITNESNINKFRGFDDNLRVSVNREFILEGSEYKAYTSFTSFFIIKMPDGYFNESNESYEGRELMVKDRGWFDYISLVFQECVKRQLFAC